MTLSQRNRDTADSINPVAAVPGPSSLALLIGALAGFGVMSGRKSV
jgi:hypothetical protein